MQTYETIVAAGNAAIDRRDFRQALEIFDAIYAHHPGSPHGLMGMGIALSEMGHIGASIALFETAARQHPDGMETWSNLGASLRRAGHVEASRGMLEKALALVPDDPTTLGNLASTYINDGRPEKGVVYGRKAVRAQPESAVHANNLALCLMELGRFPEAWPYYERRLEIPGTDARHYPGARWDGGMVESLVVHGEQGLGDEIMFLAYVDEVRRRVTGRLVLEVAPRLVTLVARSFPDCEVIGTEKDFTGTVAAHAAMGSLPQFFNGGVPIRRSGYIVPDPRRVEAWASVLGGGVLLAHKGGTMRTHEMVRNPPREAWAPILAGGRDVYSIQYGPRAEIMAEDIGVPWLAEAAGDIEEQAAAIKAAGCLVSVAQTALHLGGAMGVPVLGIISDKPAWRYGLKGGMPWYETVRLFRKQPDGDWREPIQRAAATLTAERIAC